MGQLPASVSSVSRQKGRFTHTLLSLALRAIPAVPLSQDYMDGGNLSWRAEIRATGTLKDLSNNPRKITAEAFDRLKKRIQARGFHDVIKLDTEDYILSGNQRKRALMDLGIEEVNVLVPSRELTKEERDKIIIESNRNEGEWDFDILGNEFEVPDLIEVGFSERELGMGGGSGEPEEAHKCEVCGRKLSSKKTQVQA